MTRFSAIALAWAAGAGLLSLAQASNAGEVVLYDGARVASVIYDGRGKSRTLGLAANLLAKDLSTLTGKTAKVSEKVRDCAGSCVVVGLYDSPEIHRLAGLAGEDISGLKGQWEVYRRFTVRKDSQIYVVIAGSDQRGAVYGTVDLSRTLGVSPWEWWADVTPRHRDRLAIDDAVLTSKTPSVQYRGMFLNDEDWGLVPWAAKTFDPKTGNIGPKTYEKVFELMWRLKANTVWPAMHSISTPFYGDKGNPPLAEDYAVVVGTSHAEPMMRNNLREWDEHARGPFDFTKNRPAILDYWRQRAQEGKGFENIYTVGLRGLHDGPMQGANTMAERQTILQNVIGLQRDILSQVYKRPAKAVPQVYVAYHELQEAYDAGLHIPEDVTLMWADDNYGYIRRFSGPQETQRSGGSGVYYHLSYWGRPHDYLWQGTTHPYLIHEQMGRAWDMQARRMWIANVGDIKPIEFLTEYFLDLAFDNGRFKQSPRDYLTGFMAEPFGADNAPEIADIMMGYYDLAFARKPEFMGFGQTEWVGQNRHSDFTRGDGEEAQTRLKAYADLTKRAEVMAARIPADRRDAYFEMVLYPVRTVGALNERVLKLDLADLYAGQGRASANRYAAEAKDAHAVVVRDTETYNSLNSGKWRGMMDMAPRRLPVFDEPNWPQWSASVKTGCDLAVTGQWYNDNNTLPFVAGRPQSRPVTVFGHREQVLKWAAQASADGFTLSATSGDLNAANAYEQRLTLHYDGSTLPGDHTLGIRCGEATLPLFVRVLPVLPQGVAAEDNRIVTLHATEGQAGADWQAIDGLGSLGSVLRARLDLPPGAKGTPVTYDFATSTEVGGELKVIALPTHPVDPSRGLRIAVQLDGGETQTLDFATLGRSDVWKGNVLTNTAVGAIRLKLLTKGSHSIRLYPLDPGVTIDRIEVDLDRAPYHYGPVVAQP